MNMKKFENVKKEPSARACWDTAFKMFFLTLPGVGFSEAPGCTHLRNSKLDF